VEGKGVAGECLLVNERASFIVDARNAGTGEVEAWVVDENCEPLTDVQCVRRDESDPQVYNCCYRPTAEGRYSVIVTYGHVPVPQSPYKVRHTRTHRHGQGRRALDVIESTDVV